MVSIAYEPSAATRSALAHAQQSIRSKTTDPLVDCHKLRARLACDRAWNELPSRQGPDGLL